MTENTQLKTQARRTIRDLTRSYKKAVKKAMSLKKKTNDLELSMSKKGDTSTKAEMEKLNSVEERLDALADSVVLESTSARREYERLALECAMQASELKELKDLLTLCQKNEQLAKDLLCYSLARLKKPSHP